jgi:hypothetical protein
MIDDCIFLVTLTKIDFIKVFIGQRLTLPDNKGVKDMITLVASKPQAQAMIIALRLAGLNVEKDSYGYWCKVNGREVFRAMRGTRGYLVRHIEDLFQ